VQSSRLHSIFHCVDFSFGIGFGIGFDISFDVSFGIGFDFSFDISFDIGYDSGFDVERIMVITYPSERIILGVYCTNEENETTVSGLCTTSVERGRWNIEISKRRSTGGAASSTAEGAAASIVALIR
jgi:hypothetical protein